ncbi:DNA-directed RNA polymerase specialized sigma24 family protein [Chitinophaga polysaccharea]|uniref:DNA-directed RNA polymerase specialized sigma24 family protein n=1 Tax=Chitinophaga polysaccharea TaxID=1293035 RepID=A0A561PL49_9BACT|nr:hypothetical protein [Chitinophaga polysaccharea]TWF38839.1 DNA-directed RNA polymerase specialized sigma24 family protein [Chitinophaga polysaccharea]
MNREQIINQLSRDNEYHNICRQIGRDDADDLYQELMLYILEIPEEKLTRLNESCLKCFFYRMAEKQYKSKTSAFHKKYRREAEIIREHANDIVAIGQDTGIDEDVINDVVAAVQGLYWYDRGIVELYAEKGNMRTVSAETGIPLISIHGTVQNARKAVRAKLKSHA